MNNRLQRWIKDLEKGLESKDDSELAWPFRAEFLSLSVKSIEDLLDMLKEIKSQATYNTKYLALSAQTTEDVLEQLEKELRRLVTKWSKSAKILEPSEQRNFNEDKNAIHRYEGESIALRWCSADLKEVLMKFIPKETNKDYIKQLEILIELLLPLTQCGSKVLNEALICAMITDVENKHKNLSPEFMDSVKERFWKLINE